MPRKRLKVSASEPTIGNAALFGPIRESQTMKRIFCAITLIWGLAGSPLSAQILPASADSSDSARRIRKQFQQ